MSSIYVVGGFSSNSLSPSVVSKDREFHPFILFMGSNHHHSEEPRAHLEKASAHFPDGAYHYGLDNLILGAMQTQLQGLILNIYAYCMPIHCSVVSSLSTVASFLICLINDTSLLSYSSYKSGVWYETHQIKTEMLTGCVPFWRL